MFPPSPPSALSPRLITSPLLFAYLIHISRRYLGAVSSFSGLCTAQSNGFTTLPPSIFSSLTNLNNLDMRCLPIQTLPADTFTPLTSLTMPSNFFWCVSAPVSLCVRRC